MIGYNSFNCGYYNIALGRLALAVNQGNCNIGIGATSLIANTTGGCNIAIGKDVLKSNTTGGSNISLGFASMDCNTSGEHNVAIGRSALFENTSGLENIAIGRRTLAYNTTGCFNIAMGRAALYCNTYANYNIAIGRSALYENVSGSRNVAVGVRTLVDNNGGAYGGSCNVAVGYVAGRYNYTGSNNVFVGTQAGYYNTIGGSNIAIGNRSLFINAAGSNITVVGSNAGGSMNGCTYQIAVGANADTSNANYHTVWGASVNNVYNCVWAAWTNVSDCRDKVCIETIPSNLGLPFIKRLNPVSFNWDSRQSYVDKCKYEYGTKDGTLSGSTKEYGIIAQEVKEVLVELNLQFEALKYNESKDAYRFTYEGLFAPIIKSIQELAERVEDIENRLNES
jgi:hypothetical protein